MQTVVETPVFLRRAEKLLTKDEHDELIAYLATHPLTGDEIVVRRCHQEFEETQMSKLGDELVRSMAQALAHAKGKRTRSRVHKVAIRPDEIQKARKVLGLSQDQFADAFGVSASTLRKWEQGQRVPTGAAMTLFKIIEREPRAVVRALRAA